MNAKYWLKVVASLVGIITAAVLIAGVVLHLFNINASDNPGEWIVVTLFVLWGFSVLSGCLLLIYVLARSVYDYVKWSNYEYREAERRKIYSGGSGIFLADWRGMDEPK